MASPEQRKVHLALKSIMFTLIFSMGCIHPLISLYMQNTLHFDAMLTSIVLAGSTIAAITTPLVAAFIADRLVSSRMLLVICNLLVAAANIGLVFSHDFATFFVAWIVMAVAQGPVSGLANTLAFHHLEDGVRQYGPVRLWGTVGWIAAGWILSLVWMIVPLVFPGADPESFKPLMFVLALIGSTGTALMSLTLPRGGVRPPESRGLRALVPVEALRAVKSRLFIVLMVMYMGNGIMDRFFFFGAAPYLSVAGFPDSAVLAVMSVGQLVELPILAILGRYLTRQGFRNGLLIGLLLQVLRPLLLAIPGPVSAVFGLSLHGVLVGFVQLSIIMQANEQCTVASRSGVNQIFGFMYGGVANLIGAMGAGVMMNAAQAFLPGGLVAGQPAWSAVWLGNAAIGLALVAVFFVLYPRTGQSRTRAAS